MENVKKEIPKAEILKEEKEEKAVKWRKSWGYSGPLYIPAHLKNSQYDYAWVDYKDKSTLTEIFMYGWEVDREIASKIGKEYNLPTIEDGSPYKNCLFIRNSLLVRRKKELSEEMKKVLKSRIIEPKKVEKHALNNQANMMIPSPLKSKLGDAGMFVGDII